MSDETKQRLKDPSSDDVIKVQQRHRFGLSAILKPMLTTLRSRSLLGLSLMIAQAFLYNAMLFTYALVLLRYYGVPAVRAGLYLLGNMTTAEVWKQIGTPGGLRSLYAPPALPDLTRLRLSEPKARQKDG